jgi:molybdopterin/thiamine biosynthesis adenylyltransferase
MKGKLEELIQQSKSTSTIASPSFYRLSNAADKQKLEALLNENPSMTVFDEIQCQLEELVKCLNPKIKFGKAELTEAAKKHMGATPIEEYGVWVYYPWSYRLIHILDEKEFVDVRTSRNQNKITKEERDILARKKIGVIGLSVGQSVSVTLAMERVCSELRLADFDVLELTNLNRIRTGLYNLGLPKVYSVAREIAEIDPFIKVVCYPQGLLESNMDEFFTKDGKLDLLIEESDGFDIKILCRYKARELQVPVLMEASDRCMVDVERFDLEPDRGILHGLVEHLDIAKLKTLKTNEEKIPYMLDVLGIETASVRLKASMIEIEETINTWPQLASAVTMGGGVTTDVARRILLNQYKGSGRFHIDIEELIGDKKEETTKEDISKDKVISYSHTEKEMREIAKRLNENNSEDYLKPSNEEIQKLVDAAIKAPTGGNAQPWKWLYSNGSLFLFYDKDRSLSLLDFDNLASYIGLGAATENLILEANAMGLNPVVFSFPVKDDLRVIAQFKFSKEPVKNDYAYLASEIKHRATNRTISKRQVIEKSKLLQLKDVACSVKGADMIIIDEEDKITQLAEVISKVERIRLMNKRGHKDFVSEIRWNDKENEEKRDGVDLNTVDLTGAEKAGFIVAKIGK